MTNKEYVLAAIISLISNTQERYKVAEAICIVCKEENPDFDRTKFHEAIALHVK